eukprot:3728803-Rhodomonas_salina.1
MQKKKSQLSTCSVQFVPQSAQNVFDSERQNQSELSTCSVQMVPQEVWNAFDFGRRTHSASWSRPWRSAAHISCTRGQIKCNTSRSWAMLYADRGVMHLISQCAPKFARHSHAFCLSKASLSFSFAGESFVQFCWRVFRSVLLEIYQRDIKRKDTTALYQRSRDEFKHAAALRVLRLSTADITLTHRVGSAHTLSL